MIPLPPLNIDQQPEWQTLPNGEIYYDETTLSYNVVIVTTYLNFANRQDVENQLTTNGIKQLLNYYNKVNNEEIIEALKNYSKIVDLYVPYRPIARIRGLLSVKKEVFDRVPIRSNSQNEMPFGVDTSNANFILRIGLNEFESLFNTLSNTLKIYNTDVYFSNSKIGISLVDNDIQPFNTAKQIMDELSLSEKADEVEQFLDKTKQLLEKNNIDYTSQNISTNTVIEFSINNECNKIYDVAINTNNEVCKKMRIGIERYLKSNPINEPTIVALVKNIHRISKIERCKVPWPEFVETYIYPKVIVTAVSMNDVIQNFEKNKNQYLKDIIQIFNAMQNESQYYPNMTYEQTVQKDLEIAKYQALISTNKLLPQTLLKRDLYVGDNAVSRTNLDNFFNSVARSIDSSTSTYSVYEDEVLVSYVGNAYYSVVRKGEYYVKNNDDNTKYPLKNLKISKQSVKISKNGDGTDLENQPLYTLKTAANSKGVKTFQEQINKIYDLLNKFGICKMIDYSLSCTLSLAKSLLPQVEINAAITVGTITSLSFDQMITDVVPYLPKEQQELVYKELLERTSCLNVNAILFILRKILTEEEYKNYGFDKDQFSQVPIEEKMIKINDALSKLMSTST